MFSLDVLLSPFFHSNETVSYPLFLFFLFLFFGVPHVLPYYNRDRLQKNVGRNENII